jgi:hypothetical protein
MLKKIASIIVATIIGTSSMFVWIIEIIKHQTYALIEIISSYAEIILLSIIKNNNEVKEIIRFIKYLILLNINKYASIINNIINILKNNMSKIIGYFYPLITIKTLYNKISDKNGKLTLNKWNYYVLEIMKKTNNTNNPDKLSNIVSTDLFDKLIKQQLEKINSDIICEIINSTELTNEIKHINYETFYNCVSKYLGDVTNIKYRKTKNALFTSIFNDGSDYKIFKLCDSI